MTASLFRQEALEYRKDRLYGDVILLQPLSLSILVGVAALICALIISILFWGSYARKETVRGFLVPDKGIVKIHVPQAGTVGDVFVREGDVVQAGQKLLSLYSEKSLSSGSGVDTLLLDEINTTVEQLKDRINGQKSLATSESNRLKNQILGTEQELIQIKQTLADQKDRLNIQESRVEKVKKLLNSKNISELDYQKVYEEMLSQKQHFQEMHTAKLAKENALAQLHSELDQLPFRIQTSINELENKISELKQREVEFESRRSITIQAPVAGTVTALQSQQGQWLGANNFPLLAIIPKDAVFQVELYLPSRAIGFVSPGKKVRIRFDAFPYRRFGIYEGEISVVSKHALMPQEMPIPLDIKEPVYRITVLLDKQTVAAYGKEFPLQAGMSLEADIILDKQTLFEWIIDPFISLRGRL